MRKLVTALLLGTLAFAPAVYAEVVIDTREIIGNFFVRGTVDDVVIGINGGATIGVAVGGGRITLHCREQVAQACISAFANEAVFLGIAYDDGREVDSILYAETTN
jgi:hypothetical protein